jgi:hypothetical protein
MAIIEGNRLCSKAASGSPLVAYFSESLKIVVEHSRMANQTHLLFGFLGVGSDHDATPRADHVSTRTLDTSIVKILFRQHALPDCSLQTCLHTRCDV